MITLISIPQKTMQQMLVPCLEAKIMLWCQIGKSWNEIIVVIGVVQLQEQKNLPDTLCTCHKVSALYKVYKQALNQRVLNKVCVLKRTPYETLWNKEAAINFIHMSMQPPLHECHSFSIPYINTHKGTISLFTLTRIPLLFLLVVEIWP